MEEARGICKSPPVCFCTQKPAGLSVRFFFAFSVLSCEAPCVTYIHTVHMSTLDREYHAKVDPLRAYCWPVFCGGGGGEHATRFLSSSSSQKQNGALTAVLRRLKLATNSKVERRFSISRFFCFRFFVSSLFREGNGDILLYFVHITSTVCIGYAIRYCGDGCGTLGN